MVFEKSTVAALTKLDPDASLALPARARANSPNSNAVPSVMLVVKVTLC